MGGLADDLQCKVTVRCPTQVRGLSTLPLSRYSQYTIYTHRRSGTRQTNRASPRLRLAPVHGSQSDGARRRLSVMSVFPALRRSLGARTLTNISGLTNLKVEPCRRLASVGPPCAGARRTAQGVGSAWGRRSCTIAVPTETLFVRRFVGRFVVLRAVPEETLLVRLFVGRLVILRAVPTEILFVRLFVGRFVVLRPVPTETLFVRLFVGRSVVLRAVPIEAPMALP